MYSPSTRMLTVLEVLQSEGEVTGPQLAARLQVKVRSVRRYITMLRDMGIPVESEPGRYGAYRLRPGFRMPPMMFTNPEIMAVVLGLMAVKRLGLASAPGVESASTKIERVLPEELRERVRAVQGALTLNISAYASPVEETLSTFSIAAYHNQQLWIRYKAREKDYTERVIDVYGLVYQGGAWYAVAFCHLRNDLRIFRLDRADQPKLLETPFQSPQAFDALQYLNETIATMPGVWHCEVLLKTTLAEAQYRISPDIGILEETEDGVILRCWAESLHWMSRYLAFIDFTFVILKPLELKDAIKTWAANMIEMVER
jgi:predicted DNA-binding transcriptional regulator YafY